jgi:hypothetical protein
MKTIVKRWSAHEHIGNPLCKKTITFDGLWKISRTKCCYDVPVNKTTEFGDIPIGCTQTPERLSYFCTEHKKHELNFKVGDRVMPTRPKLIKLAILGL